MNVALFIGCIGSHHALRYFKEVGKIEKRLTVEALENNVKTIIMDDKEFTSMSRSESEFSLGLNRSTSIGDHMNELGLCEAGHIAITITRITLFSCVIIYAAKRVFDGSNTN